MWQKYKNIDGNDKGWVHEYDPLRGEREEEEKIWEEYTGGLHYIYNM